MMKKIYSLLFAIILPVSSIQAQQNSSTLKNTPWGWGVFAGVNYAYSLVQPQEYPHLNQQANLVAGVDVHYKINNRHSVHVRPSWTRVSDVISNTWGGPAFSLSTLKLPILYRNYVLPSHKFLFIEVGASYNRILSSNYQVPMIVCGTFPPCWVLYGNEAPALIKSAVSGLAGLGVDIPVNRVTIPVTLRYERYLSSYLFPGAFADNKVPVQFETFSLTTGINF